MPTAEFLEFIERPVRRAVILAEVEPRQALDDWITISSNVYAHVWPSFVQEDIISGGFYRRLLTVEEDGVELTRVDDASNLAPGTWFYCAPDECGGTFFLGDPLGRAIGAATGAIYIRTTDNADPTSKTLIRATFRIHLATTGIVHDDVYYEPRLTGDQLPTITQESEDLFFGITKKVANGSISLNNADGIFDKLAADWAWKNARVNLYIGGDELEHRPGGGRDYSQIGQLLTENFVPAFESAVLNVRDAHKITLQQIPINTYTFDLYPDMDPSAEGSPIPLAFGNLSAPGGSVEPVRISGDGEYDTRNTYLIADHRFQTLHSIGTVYNDGDPIPEERISRNLLTCSFTIADLTPPPEEDDDSEDAEELGTVTCDCIGQPVIRKPWETSRDYLKGYGELVAFIYTRILGMRDSDIDSNAVRSADIEELVPQAHYIDSQVSARVVIRDFERGVLGRTRVNAEGKIAPSVWAPGVDIDRARMIDDSDTLEVEARRRIEGLYSKVVVRYGSSSAQGTSRTVFAENNRTKLLYLDGRDEELILDTRLVDEDAAQRHANRVAIMTQRFETTVRLAESGIRMMDYIVGDRIFLTLRRAPSSEGQWIQEIFEIDRISKILAPTPRVEVTLNNLRGVGAIVGIWADNNIPNYADASIAERSRSGWWLDENNLADPNDPESRNVSVWW